MIDERRPPHVPSDLEIADLSEMLRTNALVEKDEGVEVVGVEGVGSV